MYGVVRKDMHNELHVCPSHGFLRMRCILIAVMQHALVQQVLPLIMSADGSVPGRAADLIACLEAAKQKRSGEGSAPRARAIEREALICRGEVDEHRLPPPDSAVCASPVKTEQHVGSSGLENAPWRDHDRLADEVPWLKGRESGSERERLRMPRHHVANCLGTKLPREIRMSGPLCQRPSRSSVAPQAPAQLDDTVHLTQHGLQSGCFPKRDDALIDEGALLHATLDVRDDQTAHRMGLPMSPCRQKLWHTICNGEGPGRLASR